MAVVLLAAVSLLITNLRMSVNMDGRIIKNAGRSIESSRQVSRQTTEQLFYRCDGSTAVSAEVPWAYRTPQTPS